MVLGGRGGPQRRSQRRPLGLLLRQVQPPLGGEPVGTTAGADYLYRDWSPVCPQEAGRVNLVNLEEHQRRSASRSSATLASDSAPRARARCAVAVAMAR
ncbi:hypothetical protein ACFFX0_17665 [Citricoccus parietis]|uniref:Uncharacterized protein n=1 Tax=Citricoccus parietis TaxID=592307 RepID=A0ABV5G1X2_9MICC